MNFGAFAGGLSQGFNSGVNMGKTMRDIVKDKKLQDLREKGMAEAEAQRAQSVRDMVKEGGVTGEPTSGPIDTSTPKVETPEAATPSAVRTGAVETQSLPALPPGVGAGSEGAAGEAEAMANMKAPPSVSTQAPAPMDPRAAAEKAAQPGGTYTPRWEGDTGPDKPAGAAPAKVVQPSAAQATPQAVAAAGVAQKPNGKFTVNGQSYDTREQAQAAAEKSAPSTMDLFMKNTVPKLAAQYVINGEPEKAKAWTDYSESANGKRAIKDWAAAYTAPDFDTAASRFGKYYTEHINDGVDYTGHKLLTKQNGTQVAVVTLKDKASGKTMEMEMTRERMLAMGAANNPQKLFETEQAKQTAAEKLKLEYGMKSLERAAKREDDIYMEGVKQGGALKLESFKQKGSADLEDRKARNRIDTKAFEKQLEQDLGEEGADRYMKRRDPAEAARMLDEKLSDPSHPDNREFKKLNREQRDQYIQERLKSYDRIGSQMQGDAEAKPATQPAPNPNTVYRNNQTGERFRIVDGKRVPVSGPATPQAGGVPAR